MQLLLSLCLVALSLIGIADAGYLTYEKYAGIIPPCTPGFQCEAVLSSPYASLLGIPLSVFGLVYYLVVCSLAIWHFLQLEEKPPQRTALDILTVVSIAGFGFSLYLVFVMGIILKAWCLYCLVSAATSTTIFLVTQLYVHSFTQESNSAWKAVSHSITHFLYTRFLKPVLFLFSAETVHNWFTVFGEKIGDSSLCRKVLQLLWRYEHPSLRVLKAGVQFPNPIGLAAGFDYDGHLMHATQALGFGWHTIGTVTREPYAGNTPPRLDRFPQSHALLVNKGLKSAGAEAVIARLSGVQFSHPVGISIASTNKHFASTRAQILDILSCFKLFEEASVSHSYYELNISCPNTFGGEPFTTPQRLETLLRALDELELSRPVFVKMPIDQSDEDTLRLLKVCDEHTVAGVIFGNLTKDKDNPAVHPQDKITWKSRKGNVSGKPTAASSLRGIKLTRKNFKNRFVIIGTGGIFSAEDAQEKLAAGADLIQMITGMVYEGPQQIGHINRILAQKKLKQAAQ